MEDPSRVRLTGPLTPFAEGLAAELARQGCTRNGAVAQLRLLAHLSRWLGSQSLDASALAPPVMDAFPAARRSEGYELWLSRRALAPLVAYLDACKVLTPATQAPLGATEALLLRCQSYLVIERGLMASTAEAYVHYLRPLLPTRSRDDLIDVTDLTAADVSRFVVATCPWHARGSAKLTVTTLRSLLHFFHTDGLISAPLAPAVPRVARWRLAGRPRRLEARSQVPGGGGT